MEVFTDDTDLTDRVFRIMGFHVADDAITPAAATVRLRNGGATGDVYIQIEVAASGSRHFAADRPILFPSGLFIEVDGGLVAGSIQPG